MLVDLLTKSPNLLLQTLPGLSECECQNPKPLNPKQWLRPRELQHPTLTMMWNLV